MKPKVIVVIVVALLVFFSVLFQLTTSENIVTLGGVAYKVEIADSEAERTLGLSGHEPLGENEGMLFVFDKPVIHSFWMKGMLFPIDIIWIDENKRVVHIEKSVLPETFPQTFASKEPTLYVLEIDAGEADKLQIGIGDVVDFSWI